MARAKSLFARASEQEYLWMRLRESVQAIIAGSVRRMEIPVGTLGQSGDVEWQAVLYRTDAGTPCRIDLRQIKPRRG